MTYVSIRLDVKSTHLNFNYYTQNISKTINLKVTNSDKDVIEIGDDYAFTNDEYFAWYNKMQKNSKKFVEANISIYNADEHKDSVEKFNIKNEKIGDVLIHKEHVGEFSGDGTEAMINFRLFVKAELFNYIYENITSKNKIANISLDVVGLDYGWEPDGSRMIWSAIEEKRTQMTDLQNFSISFNPLTQQEEVNVYDDDKESVGGDKLAIFKLLNQIKLYTAITAVATAIATFTVYFAK